jgi:acetate kinase
MTPVFVVLNAGSSSLKFQVFEDKDAAEPSVIFKGLFEGLGSAARFLVKDATGAILDETSWGSTERVGHEEALMHLVSWLREHQAGRKLTAIGHRVVHGGETYRGPVLVDDGVLTLLDTLVPLAPLHQPHNLEPIRIVRRRLPGMPQIACFDTAFHRSQPEIAQMFALPREMREQGVRRYGFHGLSYEYIASVLPEVAPEIARGRVIVAHLGSGASMCALKDGKSVDSTLGFTALDGLCMGTRPGALDPGVVLYLFQTLGLSAKDVETALYKKSGLIGISGISNDMRVLLASQEPGARLAVEYFVYRAAKELGALAAVLGGVDGLVFTAGIGENSAEIRKRICEASAWLGIELDHAANDSRGPRISRSGSRVSAWVIPTNEELMIARHTGAQLGLVAART